MKKYISSLKNQPTVFWPPLVTASLARIDDTLFVFFLKKMSDRSFIPYKKEREKKPKHANLV
jgi:hypothetical protein